MKTFRFNTGVKPYAHNPPVHIMPGHLVDGNGVMVIPFDCEDVPDGAIFMYACDHLSSMPDSVIVREIHNSALLSKYAYFQVSQKGATK